MFIEVHHSGSRMCPNFGLMFYDGWTGSSVAHCQGHKLKKYSSDCFGAKSRTEQDAVSQFARCELVLV